MLKTSQSETIETVPPYLHVIAICGWPGVGKTTLAAELAHDPEIAAAFPDGILWTSLGQSPDLLSELVAWGIALGDDRLQHTRTVASASSLLTAQLLDKRALLLVDDVWAPEHAIPFKVGGPQCVMLITTRLASIAQELASTQDEIYELPVLTEDESLELLATRGHIVINQYPDESRKLVRELGGLPLALRVAEGLLETRAKLGLPVAKLLVELRKGVKLLQEKAPSDHVDLTSGTTPTVAVLLQKSVEHLASEARDCFACSSTLPPQPATFDLAAMQIVWPDNAEDMIVQLSDLGLLEQADSGRYQMHPVVRLFAAQFLSESKALGDELETRIVFSLGHRGRRDYKRVFLFGKGLLNLRPSLPKVRSEVIASLRELMCSNHSASERRAAASLLTRLRWLDDQQEMAADDMPTCLELIEKYLSTPDDRRYFVEQLTRLLSPGSSCLSEYQHIQFLVYRAIALAALHEVHRAMFGMAKTDYDEAWQRIGSNANLPEYQKMSARIKLGLGNIARDKLQEQVPSDQAIPLEELPAIEKMYLDALEFAHANAQDVLLEAAIHQDLAYTYALFHQWKDAEQHCSIAIEILRSGEQQTDDREVYKRQYAMTLGTASDTCLRKGQWLYKQSKTSEALQSFHSAYDNASQQIALLEEFFGKSGDPGLIYAYINAGDSLSGICKCTPQDQALEEARKAQEHWQDALKVARSWGIPDKILAEQSIFYVPKA